MGIRGAIKREFTIEPGLVLWLPFANDFRDYSGQSNHGMDYGQPIWSGGRKRTPLCLNGSSDYIRVENAPALNLSLMTISAWIYQNAFTAWNRIVCLQSGASSINYQLLVDTLNKVRLQFSIGGVMKNSPLSSVISLKAEYHVVGIYDGVKTYLYLNGISQGTPVSVSGTPDVGSGFLAVGCRGDTLQNFWAGCVGDVRIYNRALNDKEVWELYQKGL